MNNKLIVLSASVVLGIGGMMYLSMNVIPKALTTVSRASSSEKISIKGSYILGEKVTALSDGKDKASVNVFVVDKKGLGVKGKNVRLTGILGIEPEVGISDKNGMVKFEISSENEGTYELMAEVDGALIPKTTKVSFR